MIYSGFHISLLKKFQGTSSQPYVLLPLTTNELDPAVQSFKVLNYQTIIRNLQQVHQVLIQ